MRISEVSPVSNSERVSSTTGYSSAVESEVMTASVEAALPMNINNKKDDEKKELESNINMIDKAVEQANKSLAIYDRYLQRTIHEKTKTIMYVMKDSKTDEIVREFPPKKVQDMIAKMWEIAGLFVDEKA